MVVEENRKNIDVICQHTRDGKIIPLKIRMVDEDGEFQSYVIQGFRDRTHYGSAALPNGVEVARNSLYVFECQIVVFGIKKWIEIMYNSRDNVWKIKSES